MSSPPRLPSAPTDNQERIQGSTPALGPWNVMSKPTTNWSAPYQVDEIVDPPQRLAGAPIVCLFDETHEAEDFDRCDRIVGTEPIHELQ